MTELLHGFSSGVRAGPPQELSAHLYILKTMGNSTDMELQLFTWLRGSRPCLTYVSEARIDNEK